MRVGSLFTGIGGFDLGFERAGMECVWQVEKDRDCNRVLTNKFPNTERHEDVSKVERLPAVDVLCGGFPCQDLSVAGKRAGLDGERSGLWFEFLRIIESSKPRWVVIENVPGLLSSNNGEDFATILRGLVECGYGVAWRILDAQYFGVAQRRRRVFIVGSLGNGSTAQILFESEGMSGDSPSRREARTRVAPAVDAGPYADRGANEGRLIAGSIQSHAKRHGHAMTTQQAAESGHIVTHALRSEGADASEDGTGRGTPLVVAAHDTGQGWWNEAPIAGTLRAEGENRPSRPSNIVAFSSKDHGADAGEISPTLRSMNFDESHINGGGQVAIAFKTDQDPESHGDLSPTLQVPSRSGGGQPTCVAFDTTQITSKGNYSNPKSGDPWHPLAEDAHPPAVAFHENKSGQKSEADILGLRAGASHSYQGIGGSFGVRRLTPRECERLQGFPDDWTLYDAEGKVISDSARYRMLGNAVAVPCAEWIGKRIIGMS